MWLILLNFLVCFGSNQCTAYIPSLECDAMNALNTSFNLPTNITNHANDATNPCSKKKTNKNKQNPTNPNLSNSFFILFLHLRFKKKNCFVFSTDWKGVYCSSSSPTQITQITWYSSGLTGTIPTQIGLMTSLQFM